MKFYTLFYLVVIVLLFNCTESSNTSTLQNTVPQTSQSTPTNIKYNWLDDYDYKTSLINQIPVPINYKRVKSKSGSFQEWLQFLPLYPKGTKVRTFKGSLKWNQLAHKRVVNIDIGERDLQQCADAVMRLRSEYLFGKKDFKKIHFNYTNGTRVSYDDWRNGKQPKVNGNKVTFTNSGKKDNSYRNFKKYLIQIFSYAGTASLEKEMKSISIKDMKIGDVFIQGGHPGHAVLVVDMAENEQGEKLYLLAQSYMPAQNIHILKNPMNRNLSPWYELNASKEIDTPEWDFQSDDLKRFLD